MRFFVDEAGSFDIPQRREHRAAVAVTLAVSDPGWRTLRKRFEEFVSTLGKAEVECGEPKGRLLSPERLSDFADLLAGVDVASVTPVTMDLGHLSGSDPDALVEPLKRRLGETVGEMVFPTASDQIALLAKQTRNLNPQQILRLLTWARSLYEGIYHAILFLSHGPHAQSWNTVRIEIDPVQQRSGSREEKFLSIMMFSWMTAWSVERPFATIEGLHTDDHPFVKRFCSADGVILSDLVRPNLHWPRSRDSIGLQMADIAATIVHQAVTDLDNRRGALDRFAGLMRASPYGSVKCVGLISPLQAPAESIGDRYLTLYEVMNSRRRPPV